MDIFINESNLRVIGFKEIKWLDGGLYLLNDFINVVINGKKKGSYVIMTKM